MAANIFMCFVCLQNVLQERNEQVVKNTVKRLPLPLIVPLVQELAQRMHGHAQRLVKKVTCLTGKIRNLL